MKILVALDGSDAAFNAFMSACGMAAKLHADVTAFYVNKGREYTPDQTGWLSLSDKLKEELEAQGYEVLNKAYNMGKAVGVTAERAMAYGIPSAEILKYVEAHGIVKLIAMAHSSKGKGTQEFVESTTKSVVAGSRVPVFVTSRQADVKSMLIAVDDSDVSVKAAEFGGKIAKSIGASVEIVSVVPDAEAIISEYGKIADVQNIDKHVRESEEALNENALRAVSRAENALASLGVKASSKIKKGKPSDELIAEAGNHDLLIAGVKKGPPQKRLGIVNKLLDAPGVDAVFVQ